MESDYGGTVGSLKGFITLLELILFSICLCFSIYRRYSVVRYCFSS
jgi:hypothetical protein